jgi:protocatechuate 3,4-dioxygenase beta subunit
MAAPRPAAAQTGSIAGFVADTVGNRISGATVSVLTGPSGGRQSTTSSDGSYLLSRLNPGQYTFAARRTGYDEVTRSFNVISGTNARIDFTLTSQSAQGGVLQGTITQRGSGAAVSGAVVSLTGGAGFPTRSATADTNGFFRFTDLPTGRVRITVERSGYTSLSRQLNITEGRVVTSDFSLSLRTSELARLSGTVRDSSGNAVRSATVTVSGGSSTSLTDTTDSRGRYAFTRIVPDTYSVSVTASGFVARTFPSVVLTEGDVEVLDVVLSGQGDATTGVEGFVVDSFGNPVVGARVAVALGPVTGRVDNTDTTGAYLLDNLPPGNYTLTASATGFTPRTLTVNLAGTTRGRLDFTLTESSSNVNGTITGTVSQTDGIGISGVLVRVTAGPSTGHSTTTDNDGNYSLADLPEGTYTLTFSRNGYTSRTVTSIEVNAGETTTSDVELAAVSTGGIVTGTVTSSGSGISGVRVSLYQAGALVSSTNTDSQGQYSLTGVATGTYQARFEKAGYITVDMANVQVTQNASTILNAVLTSSDGGTTGIISGLVLDNSNRPVQNALVELDGPTGLRRLRTDADGGFEFIDLPAGSGYSVKASASGLNPETQASLVVTAGQTIDLRFRLVPESGGGGGSLAGQVRAPNGLPINGAQVTIVSGPSVGDRQTTSSQGRFNFTGLPGGTYSLDVRASGFRPARVNVMVRAGSGAFVTVTLTR